MPKLSEQQINNIYLRCNAAPLNQLLELCLDPESGITLDGLRAVNYNKIAQLEQQYTAQAEEIVWARSQDSIESLANYVKQMEQGIFSNAHMAQAKDRLRELSAAMEEEEWKEASSTRNLEALDNFIQKCTDGIFSNAHLQEAKNLAELIEWQQIKTSDDPSVINSFLRKCNLGLYSNAHSEEAKEMIERIESGSIISEWNKLQAKYTSSQDIIEKTSLINSFIQKFAGNLSETAQTYVEKAGKLLEQAKDWEEARKDWIDAKSENTILSYVNFNNKHPYSEYREDAESRIANMKEDLLTDMRRFPFKYKREDMYSYISTNALTMQDLVDKSNVLTDRGYSHIKKYPQLIMEQRDLPVSRLENPHSEEGNTDIYFFGVSGSGKTCVLAGLMSLTGQLGFRFDPKGPGGGGNYAMELRNYARTSMLPPATDQSYIQVIDGQINDENGNLHKISFIEMSGEKTAEFAAIDNPTSLEDLGTGASGLLSNDNNKVLFFVIDPTNEKNVQMGRDSSQWVMQSDVLGCVSSLLAKNPALMKKVVAVHVILTKSDTLGDFVDQNVIQDKLNEQGYQAVLADIKSLCEQYDINKQTGFHVGLYPFHVGKFMPGDVYTFDETDSLKILRVIQKNTVVVRKKGFFDSLANWFNS